jgi:putative transport protein
LSELPNQAILVLFSILVLGYLLGSLRLGKFSLGPAAILIVALTFGHFGLKVPIGTLDIGLLLFVYAAGLQAGPRFFRTFRRSKIHYLTLGTLPFLICLILTLVLAHLFSLPKELTIGLFSGALTDTTSLVAAIDAMEKTGVTHSSDVSIAYTLVYPFSMVIVIILMQFLPKVLGINLAVEEETWNQFKNQEEPPVVVKQFIISNPNCNGKTIKELNPRRRNSINISYIHRDCSTIPASPDLELRLGDIVTLVANPIDIESMKLLLGEEVSDELDLGSNIEVTDIHITEPTLVGKSLAELRIFQQHRVVISKIRRQGMDFIAKGTTHLDLGDQIRIVGEPEMITKFTEFAGARDFVVNETNMLPFLLGILLGIILGSIPFSIGNEVNFKLGLSGGTFIVSLIMGHYGKIGRISMYVPQAAKNLCRELGLSFFLAAAGTYAGSGFWRVLLNEGGLILLLGAITTSVAIATTIFLAHRVFKLNFLSTLGIICGNMSNSSGLAALRQYSDSELPALAYTTIYPFSLIIKILAIQVLVILLDNGWV